MFEGNPQDPNSDDEAEQPVSNGNEGGKEKEKEQQTSGAFKQLTHFFGTHTLLAKLPLQDRQVDGRGRRLRNRIHLAVLNRTKGPTK